MLFLFFIRSTKELIKPYSKTLKIKVIEINKNVGFAKVCNLVPLFTKPEFLFKTNQDMLFIANFF